MPVQSTPNNDNGNDYFDVDGFRRRAIAATHPEQIRDMLCLILDELVMRSCHTARCHPTGFEMASYDDLCLAFYCAVNQMIIMWSNARTVN